MAMDLVNYQETYNHREFNALKEYRRYKILGK